MSYDNVGVISERKVLIGEGDVHSKVMSMMFKLGIFPLIRTKALQSVGGFDEEYKAFQDIDMWMSLTERYKVACVYEPLIILHGDINIGHVGRSVTGQIQGLTRALEKYRDYYERDKYAHWGMLLRLSWFYKLNGEYGKFFKTWCRAVSLQPLRIKHNLVFPIRAFLPRNLTYVVITKWPKLAPFFLSMKKHMYGAEQIVGGKISDISGNNDVQEEARDG